MIKIIIKEKSKEKITKNAREGSLRVLNNSEDNYQNQQTSSKKHLQTKETANFNGEDLNENHSINNIKDDMSFKREKYNKSSEEEVLSSYTPSERTKSI